MEKKNRPKMSISDRAKQFMPFMAVTGLDKALLEKEKEVEKEYQKNSEPVIEEC